MRHQGSQRTARSSQTDNSVLLDINILNTKEGNPIQSTLIQMNSVLCCREREAERETEKEREIISCQWLAPVVGNLSGSALLRDWKALLCQVNRNLSSSSCIPREKGKEGIDRFSKRVREKKRGGL